MTTVLTTAAAPGSAAAPYPAPAAKWVSLKLFSRLLLDSADIPRVPEGTYPSTPFW